MTNDGFGRREWVAASFGLVSLASTSDWTAAPRASDAATGSSSEFYSRWSYSKPSDIEAFVEANATRGDARSVLNAYDAFGEYFPMYKLGAEKVGKYDEVLNSCESLECVVEIGTFLGYSAIATASRLAKRSPEKGRLLCVEYEERHAEVARWALNFAGLSDRVTVLTMAGSDAVDDARAFVDAVKGKGGRTDVLFLDHAKERYLPDLQLYEKAGIVGAGTLVVADNVVYPGAPGFLEYVDTTAGRYRTRLIDAMFEYDQVWKPDWIPQKDALSVSLKL